MTEARTSIAAATLGVLTLAQVNTLLGIACGVLGVVIALPKAVHTIRSTDWKNLFRRRP